MSENWSNLIEPITTEARPAGTTMAILEDIQLKEVPVWGEPEKTEQKFEFRFKFIDAEGGMCRHRVRPKMTQKSGMLQLLSDMSPSGVPPEALKNPDAYWHFATKQIGKTFWVKHEPSKDNKWNNFVSVMPILGKGDEDESPFLK